MEHTKCLGNSMVDLEIICVMFSMVPYTIFKPCGYGAVRAIRTYSYIFGFFFVLKTIFMLQVFCLSSFQFFICLRTHLSNVSFEFLLFGGFFFASLSSSCFYSFVFVHRLSSWILDLYAHCSVRVRVHRIRNQVIISIFFLSRVSLH